MSMLLIASVFVYFTQKNTRDARSIHIDEMELIFANHYISYVIETDKRMSFNVFGVFRDQQGVPLLTESISSVALNNQNLEIVDFSIETGITHEDYTLFNMIIDVQVLSDHVERADRIHVYFDDQQMKSFPIGEMTIQNAKRFASSDFAPTGGYTVGYPHPSLDGKIQNSTKDTVSLQKIEDLNQTLTYTFEPEIRLDPQKSHHIIVSSFETEEEFDFYTVTPLLHYSINGNDQVYPMPGVLYGVLDPDEEKVKRIIN